MVIGTGKDNTPHTVAPRPFIDLMQGDQIVLDDFRQGPFDARSCHVHQNIDAAEQPVDHGRVSQIAVHHVLAIKANRQGTAPAG